MTPVQKLSGWGRTPTATTDVVRAFDEDQIRAVLKRPSILSRGLITRGLGRSYGDAAQRSGGTTLVASVDSDVRWVDEEAGLVHCPASLSIGELIEFADQQGFFVPVTPGTRYVTLAGALAADIHGKDHHRVGSIGEHIVSFRLMLANGEIVDVDRERDRSLFDATIGGMGLTGVVLDMVIQMHAVPGNRILVETYRTSDLESTMSAMDSAQETHRYSVAWIDLMASGANMGRGVVTNGNHTTTHGDSALHSPFLGVPSVWRWNVVRPINVRHFNELWFRKAPKFSTESIQKYDQFFYPLDMVGDWNRLYGTSGFLQYQFVIPHRARSDLPGIVEMLSSSGVPIFLAVLKRFGSGSSGYLSFPIRGWTLAMDIPIPSRPSDLEQLLRRLDVMVVEAGGRVYLAKDSRLGSDLISEMYPELPRFREVRDRVDPDRRFRSDLAVRVGL